MPNAAFSNPLVSAHAVAKVDTVVGPGKRTHEGRITPIAVNAVNVPTDKVTKPQVQVQVTAVAGLSAPNMW